MTKPTPPGPRPRIEHLADHSEALPVLAAWFEAEWPSYYGPDGPGDARRDLDGCARRGELPIGFVAYVGDELCGTMALKRESVSILPHLSPWVAAGLVRAPRRRQGIGAALLDAVEETARRLGFTRLYCGTAAAMSLLDRSGWRFRERVAYGGEDVAVYEKDL
ncbi:MAG TPA: GNAT family N-acetyltransferase [Candidatus Eisenbacteria bacterium]|nr:GNAT family N-acetyltransferase [Candidatus Eisenbacteria bacterium]